jgi:hypothetical protein
MKALRYIAVLATAIILAVAHPAEAACTHGIPDNAKLDILNGAIPAAATIQVRLITSAATAGPSTSIWSDISANEAVCTGTCTGYVAGTGWTLATRTTSTNSSHGCAAWATPLQITGSPTVTARAIALVCTSGCTTANRVVSIHCLDGTTGVCAADTTSTAATFTVNLPVTGAGTGLLCAN